MIPFMQSTLQNNPKKFWKKNMLLSKINGSHKKHTNEAKINLPTFFGNSPFRDNTS